MITIESIDLELFEDGLKGLAAVTGRKPKEIIQVETGRLTAELVRDTPPAQPGKTRAAIAMRVGSAFDFAGAALSFGSLEDSPGSFFGNYLEGTTPEHVRDSSSTSFEIVSKERSGRIFQ
jgi:hypothetical protein